MSVRFGRVGAKARNFVVPCVWVVPVPSYFDCWRSLTLLPLSRNRSPAPQVAGCEGWMADTYTQTGALATVVWKRNVRRLFSRTDQRVLPVQRRISELADGSTGGRGGEGEGGETWRDLHPATFPLAAVAALRANSK